MSDQMQDLATEVLAGEGDDFQPPSRHTQEGIAERRSYVKRWYSRRVPQVVMAKLLGVSRRTIYDDVQQIKEEAQAKVKAIREDPDLADLDIGLTVMRLEGVSAKALAHAELARTDQMRNLFLNTAIKAELGASRLKIDTGILPKVGEEIRVKQDTKITFKAKVGSDSPLSVLDTNVSRRKVMTVVEKLLAIGATKRAEKLLALEEQDANTIDVTPTPPAGE